MSLSNEQKYYRERIKPSITATHLRAIEEDDLPTLTAIVDRATQAFVRHDRVLYQSDVAFLLFVAQQELQRRAELEALLEKAHEAYEALGEVLSGAPK